MTTFMRVLGVINLAFFLMNITFFVFDGTVGRVIWSTLLLAGLNLGAALLAFSPLYGRR